MLKEKNELLEATFSINNKLKDTIHKERKDRNNIKSSEFVKASKKLKNKMMVAIKYIKEIQDENDIMNDKIINVEKQNTNL